MLFGRLAALSVPKRLSQASQREHSRVSNRLSRLLFTCRLPPDYGSSSLVLAIAHEHDLIVWSPFVSVPTYG